MWDGGGVTHTPLQFGCKPSALTVGFSSPSPQHPVPHSTQYSKNICCNFNTSQGGRGVQGMGSSWLNNGINYIYGRVYSTHIMHLSKHGKCPNNAHCTVEYSLVRPRQPCGVYSAGRGCSANALPLVFAGPLGRNAKNHHQQQAAYGYGKSNGIEKPQKWTATPCSYPVEIPYIFKYFLLDE